ncbi:MAG: phosphopantetheine-binding protein [Ekhidna sp.]
MNQIEIRKHLFRLLRSIAPETEPEELRPDQNIREALNIDSFDYLVLVTDIEETFGIETPEDDYGKIGTLEEIENYIQQKLP